jgi:hypothetical protein
VCVSVPSLPPETAILKAAQAARRRCFGKLVKIQHGPATVSA